MYIYILNISLTAFNIPIYQAQYYFNSNKNLKIVFTFCNSQIDLFIQVQANIVWMIDR